MARDFDGSADYLLASAVPVSGYPFTMSCWVYVDSFSTTPYFFQFGNSADAASRLGLNFTSGGAFEASSRNGSNTRTWTTTATASTGAWHHVMGAFDSAASIIGYLNGVSTGSAVVSTNPTFASFNRTSLGVLPRSTLSNYLNGRIAEAAIWNVSLAGESAAMLYSGHSPQFVRTDALVAYWPLHGRAGAAGDEEDWVGSNTMAQTSSPALADHPRIIYPRRRTHVYVPSAAPAAPTITALSAISITATSAQPQITYA